MNQKTPKYNKGNKVKIPITSKCIVERTLFQLLLLKWSPDRLFDITVRDSFIINPQGYIRSILTLPITCGRSGEEMLRVLDSLIINENYGLSTPAGWKPGDSVITPAPHTVEGMMEINQQTDPNLACPFWYLCYTNINNYIESNSAKPNASEPNINTQSIFKKLE